jgi:endonuclease YncB( thermonuclease family)
VDDALKARLEKWRKAGFNPTKKEVARSLYLDKKIVELIKKGDRSEANVPLLEERSAIISNLIERDNLDYDLETGRWYKTKVEPKPKAKIKPKPKAKRKPQISKAKREAIANRLGKYHQAGLNTTEEEVSRLIDLEKKMKAYTSRYPTKLNRGGNPQAYDPFTGRWKKEADAFKRPGTRAQRINTQAEIHDIKNRIFSKWTPKPNYKELPSSGEPRIPFENVEYADRGARRAAKETAKETEEQAVKGLKGKLFTKKNLMIGGGVVLGGIILKSILSEKEKFNPIEGFHPGSNGLGSVQIRRHSDFGSGYQGLPTSLRGAAIDPELLEFRANVIDDKEERKALRAKLKKLQDKASENVGSFRESDYQKNLHVIKGLNLRNKKLREINLDKFKVNIEDADTLILERKGLSNLFSKDVVIRLGGIDAPEVASHEDDPLEPVRIWQGQPGGEEATQSLVELADKQKHLSLVIGGEKTYGRYVGAFMGDNSILNVDLARSGDVAALPFGDSAKDVISRREIAKVSKQAYEEKRGMWSFSRYRALHEAQSKIGQSITFNTFTRKDKLAQNLNLAAYGSFLESFGERRGGLTFHEKHVAKRLGYSLKKTHGPHRRAYNKTEGMHPGSQGMGAQQVRKHSEFGSGYQGMKNLLGSLGIKTSSKKVMKAAIAAEEFAPQAIVKNIIKEVPVETAFNRLEKVLANPNKPFSKENIVELSKLAKTDTLEEFMGRLDVIGRPGLKEEFGQAGLNFVPAKRIEEIGGLEALGSDPIELPSLLKEYDLEFGAAYIDTGLIKALPELSEGVISVRQAEDFGKAVAFHEATELRNSERYLAKHYKEGLDFRHEAAIAQEEFFIRSRNDHFSYNEFLSLRSFSDPEYTGYKQGLKLATGDKASHNTIEGLRHGGLAEDVRKALTDFGSGYQGLRKLFRGTTAKATIHKPMISLGKLDEANKAVEHFFEAVRTKEFPHRPSRLNSSYWSPKKEMAHQYAKGKNAHLSSVSVDDSNLFVTDNEAFVSGGLALHDPFGGGETAALSYARDYWKGVSYEKALKLKAPEALIPGVTKAERTWSANKAINEIEGLHPGSEGLGTQQVRKHSEFGSGYKGSKKSEDISYFDIAFSAAFVGGAAITGRDRFGAKGGLVGAGMGLAWLGVTKGIGSLLEDDTIGKTAYNSVIGGIQGSAFTSMIASSMMRGGTLEGLGKKVSKGFSNVVGKSTKSFLKTNSGADYLKAQGKTAEEALKDLTGFLDRTVDDPRGLFAVVQESGEVLKDLGTFMLKGKDVSFKDKMTGGLLKSLTNPYVQGFLGSPKLAGAIKKEGLSPGFERFYAKNLSELGDLTEEELSKVVSKEGELNADAFREVTNNKMKKRVKVKTTEFESELKQKRQEMEKKTNTSEGARDYAHSNLDEEIAKVDKEIEENFEKRHEDGYLSRDRDLFEKKMDLKEKKFGVDRLHKHSPERLKQEVRNEFTKTAEKERENFNKQILDSQQGIKDLHSKSDEELFSAFLDESTGLKDISKKSYFKKNLEDLYYGSVGGIGVGVGLGTIGAGFDLAFGDSEKEHAIERNKKFTKHSEASVGIGLRSAHKAGKGHSNYGSTRCA